MAIAADFDDLTFSCSSTRYIGPIGTSIEEVLGSFGSNVKATVDMTVDGATRTGILIEGSRTNVQFYSQQFDQYDTDQVTVNTNDTGTDDPLGTNTADEVVPSTNYNDHFIRKWITTFDENTPEGTWAASIFGKDNGYDLRMRHQHTGDQTDVNYDLSAKSVGSTSGIIDSGADDASDGWCFCWYTRDINDCAAYEWLRSEFLALDGTDYYFTGDGSSAFWGWQAQFEFGEWPSSIIPNSGTSDVTRAAANGYWDSTDVTSNLRGKITLYIIPEFGSAQLYDTSTEEQVLLHFDDATQDIKIYLEPGTSADTGRIVVDGASALVTSGNHTWSRGQILKIVIDPGEGDIITSLFTTGNGTHSGTSWSTDDGDVYLGQSSSNADHFFGLLFEPEYEEAAIEEALFFGRFI